METNQIRLRFYYKINLIKFKSMQLIFHSGYNFCIYQNIIILMHYNLTFFYEPIFIIFCINIFFPTDLLNLSLIHILQFYKHSMIFIFSYYLLFQICPLLSVMYLYKIVIRLRINSISLSQPKEIFGFNTLLFLANFQCWRKYTR